MKKYNKGDVWTYDPDPENRFRMSKDELYALDAMSRRPVVIIRASDDDNPYKNVLVCPGTTRSVPAIKFDQCETTMSHGQKMTRMAIKPYEVRSIATSHLIKYCGRLEDFEIKKLSDAVEAYLGGGAIADFCDEETMVEWTRYKNNVIVPNEVRKGLQQNAEEPETPEPEVEEDSTPEEAAVKVPEKLNIPGHFTIPKTMGAIRKVCKSYCGSTTLNPGTVAMIETVPLSDVEIILSLYGKQIQEKYTISPSAAGAVKLLAANFKENGYKFVWPADDSAKETKPEVKPAVVVPAKAESVKPETKPEVVTKDESSYDEAIATVKYFLTDKTMRYINNKALDVLLTIPEEIVKKHYSGSNFKLQYGAVLNRVGRYPSR